MSAVLSPCRRYRYRLDRNVGLFGSVPLGFMLHNPSTVDEAADDPTLRRCLGFAAALGAARLVIVNPWAGRATDPDDLWAMVDPIGPDNDAAIADAADEIAAAGGFMLVGWGRIAPPARLRSAVQARIAEVIALLADIGCELRALGANGDGSPKHPLYLRADATPLSWPACTRAAA